MHAMQPHQLRSAVDTLAAAFMEDPFFVYLFDDRSKRHRWLEKFMAGGISLCPAGAVYLSDDDPPGVIALYPPGSYPPATARGLWYMARMGLESVVSGMSLRRMITVGRVMRAIDAAHPTAPCWYVLELGVAPAQHGKGIGGRLTQHALGLADADRLPVYLETTNGDNLSYYRHFGFELVGTLEHIGDAPPVWRMQRPAATAASAEA